MSGQSAVRHFPTSTRRQFLGAVMSGLGASMGMGGLASRVAGAAPRSSAAGLATALVHDPLCKCHIPDPRRPECPQRYDAVMSALRNSSFFLSLKELKPRYAADEELLTCHKRSYLDLVRREIAGGACRLSTGDTRVCCDSLKAAHFAAGAGCVGVDTVLGGHARNAFCLLRPPGHHATPDRGMGFCIFNNVAIAARYAQQQYRVGKVLIIDWDLHHGNGTQDIFYEDPSVFYFSTHQSPGYPGTGKKDETGYGKGLGTTLNCPLAPGSGRKEFFAAFLGQLAPAVARFKPELILISAGFDARHGDPLGRLELTDPDYFDLTDLVMDMASQYAGGRLVSLLEGGYSLDGLAKAATAHCARLCA